MSTAITHNTRQSRYNTTNTTYKALCTYLFISVFHSLKSVVN